MVSYDIVKEIVFVVSLLCNDGVMLVGKIIIDELVYSLNG